MRELKSILSFPDAIYEAPRPGEIQRIYLDASRAKQVSRWQPTVTFRAGLERTVDWSRHNKLPTKH